MARWGSVTARRERERAALSEGRDEEPPAAPQPEAPDNRYRYRFDDPREWAPAVLAIRAAALLRRDGDPFEMVCENEQGGDALFHFAMENIYFLGVTVNERAYEFGKKGKAIHEIPGSTFFGYDSGYIDFGVSHSLTVIKIGYEALKHSIMEIVKGGRLEDDDLIATWMDRIGPLMPTILVMLPESARFKWHFLTIERIMGEEYAGDVYVSDWMGRGIKNWQYASGVAFGRTAIFTDLPPPGAGHVYTMDDMETALKDWIWAGDLLVVACIIELKPIRVIAIERRLVGKRIERCLHVEWNNSETNWQTVTRMRQDFPWFETRVTPPILADPPDPPEPDAPAG